MEPACAEESPRLGSVGTGGPVSEEETVDVGGGGDGDAGGESGADCRSRRRA